MLSNLAGLYSDLVIFVHIIIQYATSTPCHVGLTAGPGGPNESIPVQGIVKVYLYLSRSAVLCQINLHLAVQSDYSTVASIVKSFEQHVHTYLPIDSILPPCTNTLSCTTFVYS